ncbi:hypothetical protein AQJ30_22650 [Streptomyces longwoodensis]|uniref:ScoMcrA-like SRA domain-containing protein n=1 Tax=Streptomyces longwoodensis TaxID=68231 RepID=A0A101QUI1_9ACTN|nr:hypothetical protein [Streptomyces longwoodensis]KUN36379.1 hypothetical protein AQJ30_22650 [Streptomyces longwoodensis]
MAFWLLTCNPDIFDLDALRRGGEELESWSVARYRSELATDDHFVMWLTGPQGGLVGRGRITGVPFFRESASNDYWQEDPGPRWYVPLEIDEWLDAPVPRAQFTTDDRFDGTTTLRTLFAGNPHRLNEVQWEAFEEAFSKARLDKPDRISWHLNPGDTIRRVELHDRYGGSRQGGICKSARNDNVLIFTDPNTGHQHGYYDEWAEDGSFHYTGDGQKGPQTFDSLGNRSVRDHVQLGLRLRLFEGSRGIVRYVGEFALDPASPYSYSRAPETGGGPLRQVIRFHLIPVGSTKQPPTVPVGSGYHPADESVQPVPAQPGTPDSGLTERNLRAHRHLQNALAAAVAAHGLEALSPRATDPDFDLAWRDSAGNLTVCEVKSLTAANETRQLRTGLGQLLDYHDRLRERAPKVHAVLWVEYQPSEARWIELCRRVGITLAWPGREVDAFDSAVATSV